MAQASPDQPESSQPETGVPRRRRFVLWHVFVMSGTHRRWRWFLRGLAAAFLLLVAAVVVLTHSPVTKWLILPRISKESGLDVDADWIHIRRNGDIVMDHVRLTIPGIPGEAGRFFRVASVRAGVDWLSTLGGTPKLTGVDLVDPVMVVSQSTDDDTLNIGAISPPSQSGRKSVQIPSISVSNLSLELAEHGSNGFHTLKRIPMDGQLTPSPDVKDEYGVHLQETIRHARKGDGSGPGFNLDGTVGALGINLNLVNFSLTDWPAGTLPPSVREISQKLDLIGQVSSAQFTYNKVEGITARLMLQGVAMNLPVEAEVQGPVLPAEGQAPRYLRMSKVNGSIVFAKNSVTAKVGGMIEDLPYNVSLKYDGVDENSPFNIDFETLEFPVAKNPELLLYAPPTVKYYLNQVFLRPTGIITTRVNVKRGPPNQPGPGLPVEAGEITVSGSLDFHDGTAAYEGFPYEFEKMSGRFEFSNDAIKIIDIRGVSPTGARLHSHGEIAPLDESSEVTVFVDVTNARIDEFMEAAFGPERSQVLKALFNETRYKELLDAELVRSPEQATAEAGELANLVAAGAEADAARIAKLQARSNIPIFAFGASADVNVRVHSPRGVDVPYVTSVDIRMPKAGLLPDKFPYPIEAEDIGVEIRNTEGVLKWGTFRGLTGGRADIKASFNVPKKSDPDPQVKPEVDINVTDMPLDGLMIHALPGSDGAIQRILSGLGVSALGSGNVHIAARPGQTGDSDLGFDADVDIRAGEARPESFQGSGVLAISDFSGHFEASERKLFLDIDGVPVLSAAPDPAFVGPAVPLALAEQAGGTLTVHVRGDFPPTPDAPPVQPAAASGGKAVKPVEPAAPATFFVHATCPTFDLAAPVESIVGVFSPKAAATLAKVRGEQKPSGFVDMKTQVQSDGPGQLAVNVEVSGGRSLGAEVMGSRLLMPEASGKAELALGADGGTIVTIDAMSGSILFAGLPGGIASVDGSITVDGPGAPADGPLEVTLLDAQFESALTRAVLEQQLGADAIKTFNQLNPIGKYDATLNVHKQSGGKEGGLTVQGQIEPRSLALKIDDRSVVFDTVSGSVEFEPGSGVLRELSLSAPAWEAKADGGWTIASDGRLQLRTELSGRGDKLTDDLVTILPPELRSVLSDLKLKVDGPFRLVDSALDITRGGEGSGTQFSGRFDFAGTSLDAGVPISDATGSVLIKFDNSGGAQSFRLDTRAQRFQVEGVTLMDGRAVVQSGRIPGTVRIPEASGMCHGGRFSLVADVTPLSAEPDAKKEFNVDLRMSGLRFNTLMRELIDSVKPFVGPPTPLEAEPAAAPKAAAESPKDEFSRGLLDGEFTLRGRVGDPATHSGRGTIRICGGRVLNLPVVTALIEASNLQFPFNSSLDFAQARFYLEGGLITFEDMSVQSRSIEIVGNGTMTFPGKDVNLRFVSRSARPIPILSNILESFRNQLIVTKVTGKLGDLSVGLQTPGPSRILNPLGVTQSEQAKARADADRRAAAERERDRQLDRGIRPETMVPTDR